MLDNAPYSPSSIRILRAYSDLIDERGWTQAEAAAKIKHGRNKNGLSPAALSQLLSGTYAASPDAICRTIAATIEHERGRALFDTAQFARTRLYTRLTELADLAVLTQRITCLHGGLLIGKTTAAKALADQYTRAAVVSVTMPYADTYGSFIRRLAALRGLPLKGTLSDLRESILHSLDTSHLLIIDEFHQPLVSYARRQGLRTIEFIREINDTSRCGILLIGATTGYTALRTDPSYTRISASLSGADASDLLPTSDDDLAAIVASFGLNWDDTKVNAIRDIITTHNTARAFDLLRLASANAERHHRSLSYDDIQPLIQPILSLTA